MRAVAALLCLIVPTLSAQTASGVRKRPRQAATKSGAHAAKTDDTVLPLPIIRLAVEGNQNIPAAAILKIAALKPGDTTSKEAFEAARQKLADTGFFEYVAYEFKLALGSARGYDAKFQVTEVKPLYKVTFTGFQATKDELDAYLRSRDPLYSGSAPATKPVIERWAKFLEAWTAEKNHPKKVIGKLITTASNDYVVQFQPDEPLPAVARVEFIGNQAIDTLTLQNAIGAVAYGLPYSDENFRAFLEHQVKPLYEARGLLQVRFEDLTTEPVPPPVKGLLVHVKVIEGAVFKLGKVSFAGATGDDKDNLAHVAGLKTGELANFDQIGEAVERVKKSLRRSGYLHVATSVDRKLDEGAKKVDLTIKIDRGAKYEFGAVAIRGLDLIGTAAVRKQWGKQPGDPYNPDYPDYFLKEIREQGIFDHLGPTHSEVKITEDTHIADVTLVFSPAERKPVKAVRTPGEDH